MKCWIGDSTVSPAATHCLRGGYCLTIAHGLARFFTSSKLIDAFVLAMLKQYNLAGNIG